jgi:hypothetical protein
LPGVLSLQPPSIAFERSVCGIKDIGFVVLGETSPFFETSFVETIYIGHMDMEPFKTRFTERFLLAESQETSTKVISDWTEMWWDRICSSSEVHVVG